MQCFFRIRKSRNMPMTLTRLYRNESNRRVSAKKKARIMAEGTNIGNKGMPNRALYITPLSTGSFRLSIHWRSSKGRPHRTAEEHVLPAENLSSYDSKISPFISSLEPHILDYVKISIKQITPILTARMTL